MTEAVLIIIFLAILIGGGILINRVRKPLVYYIKICSALGLLILVWLPDETGNHTAVNVLISVLALASLYTAVTSLKEFTAVRRNQRLDEKKLKSQ